MRTTNLFLSCSFPFMLILGAGGCGNNETKRAESPSNVVQEPSISSRENSGPQNTFSVKPNPTDSVRTEAPLLDVSEEHAGFFGGGFNKGTTSTSVPRLSGGGGGGGRNVHYDDDVNLFMYTHWHEMSLEATGNDHEPEEPLSLFSEREQIGPGRSSRAMAIVHIAMFEAVNAINDNYESYVGLPPVTQPTSMKAAIAVAAHDTLSALYPSQSGSFDNQLVLDLATIADGPAKVRGIELGHQAAQAILLMRENDGSDHDEPLVDIDFITSIDPGKWRKDPIANIPVALGAYWGNVKPFAIPSVSQFRVPAPPDISSAEYAVAYNEVKKLGGDGVTTTTERTAEQTEIGIYWAYDATPNLCAPPRLYNQLALQLAQAKDLGTEATARLLALVNVAMADTAIAAWDSKYFYNYWRPVTGIREADPGTGPTTIGDNNPLTLGDVNFSPLGAPASNIENGVNFTPPFPAYPSGHAAFGGAMFQVLRRFFGTDDIGFTFVSDEFNGITKDNQGNVRPLKPRTFSSLSQAEEENGQSRIYLGIHWVFDKTSGISQGNQVGNYLFDHFFRLQ